jgi:hypothetical protein
VKYEKMIEGYNELREKCLELAKQDNGRLMEGHSWLRFAILDTDITLSFTERGIECYGSAYTTQTMDYEYFCFTIPLSELEKK